VDERYEDDESGEGPSQADLDELGDDGPTDVAPCPACGAEIYEDADRCGACGQYVTVRHSSRAAGLWLWIVVALAILGLLGWLIGR